jgi:hypothetical protein
LPDGGIRVLKPDTEYLPGPTQENDGTTFENATGSTTAGEGGNDYGLSFDHESFVFDFGYTDTESVHYDVTFDFTYPAHWQGRRATPDAGADLPRVFHPATT